MKKLSVLLPLLLLLSTGCNRSEGDTWDNVKTAGRYAKKGFNSLLGKDYDSQLLASEDDFAGPEDDEFIPLNEKDLRLSSEMAIPQPKKTPGDKRSGLPGMERFSVPPSSLASIFRTVHFSTDDHVLRDHEDLVTIARVVQYLKEHPKAYVIVEGHCDERAPADYNMALGTRRANHIRVLLVKQGADPNRIYPVSCGKEKPLALGHSSEDWKINRRAEFKLYTK